MSQIAEIINRVDKLNIQSEPESALSRCTELSKRYTELKNRGEELSGGYPELKSEGNGYQTSHRDGRTVHKQINRMDQHLTVPNHNRFLWKSIQTCPMARHSEPPGWTQKVEKAKWTISLLKGGLK
jgi:hypothetical protein